MARAASRAPSIEVDNGPEVMDVDQQPKPSSSTRPNADARIRGASISNAAPKSRASARQTSVEILEESDSEKEVIAQSSSKPPSAAARAPSANPGVGAVAQGQGQGKGKGKEVAQNFAPTTSKPFSSLPKPTSSSRGMGRAVRGASVVLVESGTGNGLSQSKFGEKTQEEWEEFADIMTKNVAGWEGKFKELSCIRITDAEARVERITESMEAQAQAHKKQIEALNKLIASVNKFPQSGNHAAILNFIAEDAAQEGREGREASEREKDQRIFDLEARLEEVERKLETKTLDLQTEVQYNREITNQLQVLRKAAASASKNSARPSRVTASPPADRKSSAAADLSDEQGAIISLYEEFTRVLIPHCKKTSDASFRLDCIVELQSNPTERIEFSLELVDHYPDEDHTKPPERWYMYSVNKAPPSVIDDLDHFGKTFRFPREQCTDLLIQLLEKMGYSLWSPQDDGDEEEEEEGGDESIEMLVG